MVRKQNSPKQNVAVMLRRVQLVHALMCWGSNSNGQLGDGTHTERLTPVSVQGIRGTVVEISAGDATTCVVLTSNQVECWGADDYGSFGVDISGSLIAIPTLQGVDRLRIG